MTTTMTPRSHRKDPALFTTGILLNVAGALALNVGAGMILGGSGDFSIYNKDSALGGSTPPNTSLEIVGVATMLAGATAVACGIPLMFIGGKRVVDHDAFFTVKPLAVPRGSGLSLGLSF